MARRTISLYDAKARLSEIIRLVRERGDSYAITYHGRAVAEIRPFSDAAPSALEDRIAELEAEGAIAPGRNRKPFPRPIAHVPTALQQFLKERD